MSMYKVGDVLMVRPDLDNNKSYKYNSNEGYESNLSVSSGLKGKAGKIAKITEVYSGYKDVFKTDLDPYNWVCGEMFVPVILAPNELLAMLVEGRIGDKTYEELLKAGVKNGS